MMSLLQFNNLNLQNSFKKFSVTDPSVTLTRKVGLGLKDLQR